MAADLLGFADSVTDCVDRERLADLGGKHVGTDEVGDFAKEAKGAGDAPLSHPVAQPEAFDDALAGNHQPRVDL